MRTTPALLVLTLLASTASIAVPVIGLPGPSAHAVTPETLDIALAPADLNERRIPAEVTDVTERLLSPARFTAEFSLVGLTWDAVDAPAAPAAGGHADAHAESREPFTLSIRTRQHDGWTGWQPLEPDDDAPDAGSPGADSGRAGTAPVWTGPSDAFQVRLDRHRDARGQGASSAAGPALTGLRAFLVDPGSSAADAAVGDVPRVVSQAAATISWPTIHRRKEWGADEKLRNSSARMTGAIKAAFVHHTAGTNDYAPADVPKILRGIYAYHTNARGWSDVGYNFLVDRFGRIWEGRAGGVDRAVLGAHTGGFNGDSFGVSALGNFEKARPSEAMIGAIARVIAWKFAMYGDEPGLDPLGLVELQSAGGGTARYRAGSVVDFTRISGHRDAGSTACPGEHLFAALPQIRSLVREIIATESTYGPWLEEPSTR